MKKLFTLFLALVATTALWAYDFQVDGIYYNILTDKTNEVEVTYGSSKYTGSVAIPTTVAHNGTTIANLSRNNRLCHTPKAQKNAQFRRTGQEINKCVFHQYHTEYQVSYFPKFFFCNSGIISKLIDYFTSIPIAL